MDDVRKIKGLQSQLKNLKQDAELMKIEVTVKQKEYQQKLDSVKRIRQELERLDSVPVLKVSEHAILRWAERVKGLDVKELEKEILTEPILKMVETLGGSGSFPNGEHNVVMKNYTVVTIT